MIYDKYSYIYPPRPETTIKFGSPTFNKYTDNPNWIGQLKLNGQRNVIYIDPEGNQQWWNRHKELHRSYTVQEWFKQEVRDLIKIEPGKWTVLDSELLNNKDKNIKDTIYIYDILVLNGEYLLGSTYQERFTMLQNIVQAKDPIVERCMVKVSPHIYLPQNLQGQQLKDAWELTKVSWVEGFVFKKLDGRLTVGFKEDNNSDWMIKCRKPNNCYQH